MQKLRFPVQFIGVTTYYSNNHQGIDLGWHNKPDEPIYACADGKVTNIWEDTEFGGGLSLHIEYDNGYASDFKHLSTILVNIGDRVSQAQQVAVMGNSGWASAGTHLHFNCYKEGYRVNPLNNTYVYPGQEVSSSCKDFVLYLPEEVKPNLEPTTDPEPNPEKPKKDKTNIIIKLLKTILELLLKLLNKGDNK